MKKHSVKGIMVRLCAALMIMAVLPSEGLCRDKAGDMVARIYILSGMKKQCEQVPSMLSTGFEQAAVGDPRLQALPKGFLQNIRLAIDSVFKPENFETAIMGEMKKGLTVKDMKKVLAWLNSKTGRAFSRMEEEASSAEAMAEQQAFLKNLDPNTLPEKRKALYRSLDKATNATVFNTDMVMNMQLAMSVAIVATLPEEQQPSRDQLVQMVEKTRPQIEEVMAAQTYASFLFIYRNAQLSDLEKYVAFAATPEGTAYNKSAMAGFQKAMLDGSFAWGGVIADMLKQKPTRTEI